MAELERNSLRNNGEHNEYEQTITDVSQKSSEAVVTSEDEGAVTEVGFPVVALGASAGGLEAFRLVLQNLPTDTGMAFVLIQHLAPQHASQLTSLLAQATSMPVSEVTHGAAIKPNHVFVIPPNKVMSISRGVLELTPRLESTGVPMPINHFFRSLAEDQKSKAIGVVLSGADSDGALGLQAIREEGGITIAQSEDSAKFSGMPHNAAGAGTVDLILPPQEIARELGRIAGNWNRPLPAPATWPKAGEGRQGDPAHLNTILTLLRQATGIDLRGYKEQTIKRRIDRRMLLHRHGDLPEYVAHLAANAPEARALYEDLLINVTRFFRDSETFIALADQLLPKMLQNRSPDAPFRVWVPGCSTGEEVYSLAICLLETFSRLSLPAPIQVFGTDLSERVLSIARTGIYQETQVAELSEERRRRFFVRVQNGFQIVKSVRELCIFARQNVCIDPPFSRLDLVSCRNLLIYLGPALQQQVVATLHYALNPGGHLILGRSETLRGFPDLFSIVDKRHKFFQRTATRPASPTMIGRGFAKEQAATVLATDAAPPPRASKISFERLAERIVLREYGPPWVVVNERFEIIHSRGNTGRFLQLPAGTPSLDLLKMARESLRGELRRLLNRAKNEDVTTQSSAIQEGSDGEIRRIDVEVRRVLDQATEKPFFLVIFSSATDRSGERESGSSIVTVQSSSPAGNQSSEPEVLREELAITSQRLQTIIDERDAANQELTSANEEIQSSNEELQSINEELETAKEELQSSNEELGTLNEELQSRNAELSRIGDDLANLMASTTIPIVLLDNQLRIRRMTPITESILGIRSGDLGRPIGDIRMRLSVEDVESLAQNVLLTLAPKQVELQDRAGDWRELRLQPYRTSDNRIDGVVLVLIDIDQLRRTKEQAILARTFAESVIEAVQTPLLVLRQDLRVRLANRAFYEGYGFQPAEVENQLFLEIGRSQWNLPGLGPALARVGEGNGVTEELEFESDFQGQGRKSVCIYLRPVQPDGEKLILVLLEDITAQKIAASILVARQEQLKSRVAEGTAALRETESALFQSREQLRGLAANLLNAQEVERRRISRELHDDLSQKVAKLQFDIELLEQSQPGLEKLKEVLRSVRDQTATLAEDLRRVAHGLHPSSLDHLGLTVALRSYAEEFSRSTTIPVRFVSQDVPRDLTIEVSSTLYRIMQEALRNVGKHAPDATVDVRLFGTPNEVALSIRDDGNGFDAVQLRERGGLGLVSMEERVRLVQGNFSLQTKPGAGVRISVQIPLPPDAT